jgi:hypothetical protein
VPRVALIEEAGEVAIAPQDREQSRTSSAVQIGHSDCGDIPLIILLGAGTTACGTPARAPTSDWVQRRGGRIERSARPTAMSVTMRSMPTRAQRPIRPDFTATHQQVLGYRLARHHLTDETAAKPGDLARVVAEIGGIQSQVNSSAELALSVRIPTLTRRQIQDALWERRTLVRTWAMRGTIHLLPAFELPLWTAGLSLRQAWRRPAWLKWFGVSIDELERLLDAIRDALTEEPITRTELADAVEPTVGGHLREMLLSGWGSYLKIAANRGELAFGPDRGRNVTFVSPRAWLRGPWQAHDPLEAIDALLIRYLGAYGPAARDSIAHWWGVSPGAVRDSLVRLKPELSTVQFGKHSGLFPTAELDRLARAEPPNGVRLLGGFDVAVIASHPRSLFIPDGFESRVSRTAGWISPVLLVDGIARATWEPRRRGDAVVAEVTPFNTVPRGITKRIEPELERLGRFLSGASDTPPPARFEPVAAVGFAKSGSVS